MSEKSIELEIFKARDDCDIEDVLRRIKQKIETKGDNLQYVVKEERNGNDIFKIHFYFNSSTNQDGKLYWYEEIRNLFGINELKDLVKPISSNYGILIIEGEWYKTEENEIDKKAIYLITFGYGIYLLGDFVDYNFGLEVASRAANRATINTQSSKYFSINKNKSLVIYNNANFSTQVGEAVDYLSAELEEESGRSAVSQLLKLINERVNFSNCVKLLLKEEFNFKNLIYIIKNLETISTIYKHKFAIPKLYYLQPEKDKELIGKLDKELRKDILNIENTSASVALYRINNGRVELLNNQEGYTIYVKNNAIESGELNIKDIFKFMDIYDIEDIRKIKVKVGNERLNLYRFIDYTTSLDKSNEYYCLTNGKWTRFNKEYIDKLKDEITNRINPIVKFDENYDFENFETLKEEVSDEIKEDDKARYKERVYNLHMGKVLGYKVLDRTTESYIEVADLYDKKNKSLIHTKIGSPSDFMICINQSIIGMEHYVHNKENVIKKYGKELKEVRKIVLLLLTDNKSVLRKKDLNEFRSLRFKLNLVEWINKVQEFNFEPEIIIGQNKTKD